MKRERSRWMTALAVTCLSGVALCGCARGTRDITTDLKDSAAQEAIKAERGVAERKRQSTSGEKSKTRELAANDVASKKAASRRAPSADVKKPSPPKAKPQSEFDFEETNTDSAELALRASTKSRSAKVAEPKKTPRFDSSLETAEWAAEEFDQPVRTVSDEEEVPVAESLLDEPVDRVTTEDLFAQDRDERAAPTSKNRRSTAAKEADSESLTENQEETRTVQKKPSYDGVSAHPWAEKAPPVDANDADREESITQGDDRDSQIEPARKKREAAENQLVRRPMPSADDYPRLDDGDTSESASLKLERNRRRQEPAADPEKLEAQARVRALLAQAKSHVRNEDFRSAYRVAQTAQRIAESEDLFFTGGEEQPSDVVRSVLMKIRFEEQKLAANSQEELEADSLATEEPEDAPTVERDWTGQNAKVASKETAAPKKNANLPEGWGDVDWQVADSQKKSARDDSSNNPWTKGNKPDAAPISMKIRPARSPFDDSHEADFPGAFQEWTNTSQASSDHTAHHNDEAGKSLTDHQEPAEPEVVQAALASGMPRDFKSEHVEVDSTPQSFPHEHTLENPEEPSALRVPSESSKELATSGNWRSQVLDDNSMKREPLRVAPVPPQAPVTAPEPIAAVNELVGIDIEEPPAQAPDNSLWMILSAAAGALAMLFIRRRPVVIARDKSNGQ